MDLGMEIRSPVLSMFSQSDPSKFLFVGILEEKLRSRKFRIATVLINCIELAASDVGKL
jgi:hypothetical protein